MYTRLLFLALFCSVIIVTAFIPFGRAYSQSAFPEIILVKKKKSKAQPSLSEEMILNAQPTPLISGDASEAKEVPLHKAFENITRIEPSEGKSKDHPDGEMFEPRYIKNPYKKAGKLIVQQANENSASSCTAQFVGFTNVILTAAHCLEQRGVREDAQDITFIRAYRVRNGIQGSDAKFNWKCYGLFKNWHTASSSDGWDYAFIKLRGHTARGYLGLNIGAAGNSDMLAVGYPSNFQNSQVMAAVNGTKYSVLDNNSLIMADNPLGHGASGGAMIVGGKYVMSVNAKRLSTDPDNHMRGPVFTRDVLYLLSAVQNCK